MISNKLRCAGVAALILIATPHIHAAATSQDADQLLQHLINAAKTGNTNDFLSDLTASSREAIIAAAASQAALDAAHAEFRAALEKRFGKSTSSSGAVGRDDLRAVIGRLSAVEVLSTKEISAETMEVVARIQVKSRSGKIAPSEQTLVLQKEHDAWKLQASLPQKDPNLAARAVSACERTTRELREGQFKDRASAMVALDRAMTGGEKTN